jgi:fatty acid desaturase
MTDTMRDARPRQADGSGTDFAVLSKRVAAAGLMDRRTGYYAVRIGLVAVFYAGCWAAFVLVGPGWWTLAVAALLGVAFGQVALVAHDVAHRQVFRGRAAADAVGRVAGAAVGMGYEWWQDKHTRHHAHPNHAELDPDVAPDLLVWSPDQARAARGIPRLLGRMQAFLFFPLLMLEGLNVHVAGMRALADPSLKNRRLEGGLLTGHLAAYLAALFLVLPPGMAVAFLAVHQAVFGVYLGLVFAPNHKGMPMRSGVDHLDFLRRQVLTSRNIRGGRLTDAVMGGLNYQIEHHLFPRMPSPNLRKVQPIIRDYCREHGVAYHETGLIDSYRQALASLHRAGAPIRRRPASEPVAGDPA